MLPFKHLRHPLLECHVFHCLLPCSSWGKFQVWLSSYGEWTDCDMLLWRPEAWNNCVCYYHRYNNVRLGICLRLIFAISTPEVTDICLQVCSMCIWQCVICLSDDARWEADLWETPEHHMILQAWWPLRIKPCGPDVSVGPTRRLPAKISNSHSLWKFWDGWLIMAVLHWWATPPPLWLQR